MRAIILFATGALLLCLAVATLALGSDYCMTTSNCNLIYSFTLLITLLGGTGSVIVSIGLGIYHRLRLRHTEFPSKETNPGKKPQTKTTVAAFVVIALVILFLLVASLSKIAQEPQWDFNGSYANFFGEATFPSQGSYSLNLTMQVIIHNSTFANIKVLAALVLPTNLYSNETTVWFRTTNAESNPLVSGNTTSTQPTTLVLQGKHIQGTAFTYGNGQFNFIKTNWFSNFTAQENSCVPFPVTYVFHIKNGESLSLTLVRTNIPGLLPSLPLVGLSACP